MDVGGNLAAAQPVAIADVLHVLLPWLRVDADSASPLAMSVNGAQDALEAAAAFRSGDALVLALRALLARAEVARKAGRLATTSMKVCRELRTHNADLIDAAGAARWAHAEAMCCVVRSVAAAGIVNQAGERFYADQLLSLRLLALCSRDSKVNQVGVTGSADVWMKLAVDVDAYADDNPYMTNVHRNWSKFSGTRSSGFMPAVMVDAARHVLPDGDDVDPDLLDVLDVPA